MGDPSGAWTICQHRHACTIKAIEKKFHNSMKGKDKASKKYLWEVIEHSGLAEKSKKHEGKYTLTEVYQDTLDEYLSRSFY